MAGGLTTADKKLYKNSIKSIVRDLDSLKCLTQEISDNMGLGTTLVTTQGGKTDGLIQSNSASTGIIAEADDIRIVNVILETATAVDITVLLHDASTFTHRIYGGSYSLDLEFRQSPVSTVTVTELNGVATNVSINYLSK